MTRTTAFSLAAGLATALLSSTAPAQDKPAEDKPAQEKFATTSPFSITYTFTTSTPATPIDIGNGRDLVVNRYLTTTVNDAGRGFLNLTAGHCTNIRFVYREKRTIDSKGYCQFKDRDGDELYAEYTTAGQKPSDAITLEWAFTSGTGKYDGIKGAAMATNSNNIDDQGGYQAAGKLVGNYKIIRPGQASEPGLDDPR